ncbi:hypothetical protein KC866_00710 [Patescibacteria group bacterium]|nr:hypothetical protein [Patescibacteria group bacterium]
MSKNSSFLIHRKENKINVKVIHTPYYSFNEDDRVENYQYAEYYLSYVEEAYKILSGAESSCIDLEKRAIKYPDKVHPVVYLKRISKKEAIDFLYARSESLRKTLSKEQIDFQVYCNNLKKEELQLTYGHIHQFKPNKDVIRTRRAIIKRYKSLNRSFCSSDFTTRKISSLLKFNFPTEVIISAFLNNTTIVPQKPKVFEKFRKYHNKELFKISWGCAAVFEGNKWVLRASEDILVSDPSSMPDGYRESSGNKRVTRCLKKQPVKHSEYDIVTMKKILSEMKKLEKKLQDHYKQLKNNPIMNFFKEMSLEEREKFFYRNLQTTQRYDFCDKNLDDDYEAEIIMEKFLNS